VVGNVIFLFCQLLSMIFIVRSFMALISLNKPNPQKGFIFLVTEPVLIPLRHITPKTGRVDYSPFIAIAFLQIVSLIVYHTMIQG
jgi:uncharacterized protein YggT (Ycf19 family)